MPKDKKHESSSDEAEDTKVAKKNEKKEKKDTKDKTKKDGPLSNIVVCVDVKLEENINANESMSALLEEMGAKTQKSVTKNVNFLVWKDSSKATFNKAEELKIPIVTVKWIEECKKQSKLVDAKNYQAEFTNKRKAETEKTSSKKKKVEESDEEDKETKKSQEKKPSQDKKDEKKSSQDKKDEKKSSQDKKTSEDAPPSPVSKLIIKEMNKKKPEKKPVSDDSDDSDAMDEELPTDELDEFQSSQAEREDRQKWSRKVAKCEFIFETSGLDDADKDTLANLVEQYKTKAAMACSDDYDWSGEKFTHLITSDNKRTVKVLYAIAIGATIVDFKWLFACLEQQELVPFDKFVIDKFQAVTDKAKSRKLFSGKKFAIVGRTNPEPAQIGALIVAAGGSIVNSTRSCHYAIAGQGAPKSCISMDHKTVREGWVADSIANWEMMDETKYIITKEDCEKWQPQLKKTKSTKDFVPKSQEDEDDEDDDDLDLVKEGDDDAEKKKKKKPVKKPPKKDKEDKKDKKEKPATKKSEKKEKPEKKKDDKKKEDKKVEKKKVEKKDDTKKKKESKESDQETEEESKDDKKTKKDSKKSDESDQERQAEKTKKNKKKSDESKKKKVVSESQDDENKDVDDYLL